MSSFLGGVSLVASAKQRNVSEPEPQSRILARIYSLEVVLRGAVRLPTRTELQRSITLSGAPCRGKERSQFYQARSLAFPATQERKLQTTMDKGQQRESTQREEPTILCKFKEGTWVPLTMRKADG